MLNTILGTVLRNGLNGILGGARTGTGAAGSAGAKGVGGALGGVAGQAAIAVAMGLLLKGGGAGRLLKVGGMAALGTMAYKAWQEHQARQAGMGMVAAGGPAAAGAAAAAPNAPATNLHANGNAEHEQAMLVAMISAAKADGHVDDNERAQIEQALRQAGAQESDPELLKWLEAQIKAPLNAAEVARPAQGQPELAAKLYLISVLVASGAGTGSISASEQAWLDTLGRELQLPQEVRVSLQTQAAQLA
jgi:uncharacterized membrane protein YebE (DUF533 family)